MAVENFTTYTEVDSAGDITITSTKVDISTMRRDADSSVYKDFSANHFGNFSHDLEIYWSAYSGQYPILLNWHVSDITAATLQGITDSGGFGVGFYHDTSNMLVTLENRSDSDSDSWNGPTVDTLYYITIERSTGPDALECLIYSDSGRTTLIDTLTVTYNSTTWRYLGACGSADSGAIPDSTLSCYCQNLDINEAAGGNAPTADLQGPLVGPFGGPIMVMMIMYNTMTSILIGYMFHRIQQYKMKLLFYNKKENIQAMADLNRFLDGGI